MTVCIKHITPAQNKALDDEIDRRLAYLNFWQFCLYVNPDFFQARPFLQEVAAALQWVFDEYMSGKARRVAISMPPRAGKSYTTSLFCAWWLGRIPTAAVMRNSATHKLYKKFSYDVRKILMEPPFKRVFPGVQLSKNRKNVDGWSVIQAEQVSYFGHGTGGNIIGFGATLALSDDLYPGIEEALSDTYNEKVHTWKSGDHDSRKEKNCPEVYIGTRWSIDDVIGRAITAGRVDKVIKIAALVVSKEGQLETFCDAVKSTEEYLTMKEDTDEAIWDAEFMQEPIELKGLLFPGSGLKQYDPTKIKLPAEFTASAFDPNAEGSDWCAGLTGVKVGNLIYVTKWMFTKEDSDSTTAQITAQILSTRSNLSQIEANGAFVHLGKNIRERVLGQNEDCEIRLIKVSANKETRILQQAAFIRNHFVWPVTMWQDKEGKEFIKNLTGYKREGRNKNDDAPDVAAQLAEYYYKSFKWYRTTTE